MPRAAAAWILTLLQMVQVQMHAAVRNTLLLSHCSCGNVMVMHSWPIAEALLRMTGHAMMRWSLCWLQYIWQRAMQMQQCRCNQLTCQF